MGWIILLCWLLVAACIVVIGKLVDSLPIVGIGAVMLVMMAMVVKVG